MPVEGKTFIGPGSWLSVALVASLLGGAAWIGFAWRDNQAEMSALKVGTTSSLELMGQRFETRFSGLETKLLDRWTGTEMQLWAMKLQRANPAIAVPDPK